ncbi:MAG TPA: bifunctional phosphopantothenoylcysteine decarboxylase/phosphopantothenate--cysteine ligase CoaBC [Firmicutes bacterium]|nr:bifunctional phosphopantothenoylcysteine decarboxylase/phosphopantothenate--cysteine ligase CoaBC [Bacillota bacterium]
MPTVLFGISGSIAAFRALEVIRLLVADGITVIPVLSDGGAKFITRTSVEALSGQRAVTDIFPENLQQEIEHIALARKADLMVTCPASADIIAKYACGIADDPLALVALAYGTPHLVAPAMNPLMWSNPATESNVEILKKRGFEFIGPDKGIMACGDVGWGRLSPIEEIYGAINAALGKNGPLAGKKILVSSGATREPVDDIRYLTNRSSGRMGNAIAVAARDMGADVTLVSASMDVPMSVSAGLNLRHVDTAIEMHDMMLKEAENADAVIMTAAVADFSPIDAVKGKIKKDSGFNAIQLERTPDILLELGLRKPAGQLLVGFAAEYSPDGLEEARRKCRDKACNFICLNDVSRGDIGFETDENEIILVYPDGVKKELPKGKKVEIAREIMKEIADWLDEIRDGG